jgi:hypothetical protein
MQFPCSRTIVDLAVEFQDHRCILLPPPTPTSNLPPPAGTGPMAADRHSKFKLNLIPALQGPVSLTPPFSSNFISSPHAPALLRRRILSKPSESCGGRAPCWRNCSPRPRRPPSLAVGVRSLRLGPCRHRRSPSSGQPRLHPSGASALWCRTVSRPHPLCACSLWGCIASTTRSSASQHHQILHGFLYISARYGSQPLSSCPSFLIEG